MLSLFSARQRKKKEGVGYGTGKATHGSALKLSLVSKSVTLRGERDILRFFLKDAFSSFPETWQK